VPTSALVADNKYSRKEPSRPPITPPVPVTINNVINKTVSPPRSPQLPLDSPQLDSESRPPLISESPQLNTDLLSRSLDALSIVGLSPPWQTPPETTIKPRQESIQRSPRSKAVVLDGPNDFDLNRQNSATDIVLPQPALSYIVAQLSVHHLLYNLAYPHISSLMLLRYFDSNKMVELKRKATGRDFGKGRELAIVTESGSPRLNHQSESASYATTYVPILIAL
jgi:hypothetical protein